MPFTSEETATAIQPIYGRAQTMSAHARRCGNLDSQYVQAISHEVEEEEKKERNAQRLLGKKRTLSQMNTENYPPTPQTPYNPSFSLSQSSTHTSDSPSTPPAKRLKRLSSRHIWDQGCQNDFAADLCKLFVACDIPWNIADHPQFHLFFEKWLPDAQLPERRSLSGVCLREVSNNAIAAEKTRVANKLAMGQSDGWKNIAKTNVTSSLMSVQRQVVNALSKRDYRCLLLSFY